MKHIDTTIRRKSVSQMMVSAGLGTLALLASFGCGSKNSTPEPEERPVEGKAALREEAAAEPRDTAAETGRRGERKASGRGEEERRRRSRHSAGMQQWTAQHLYMHLAIDRLKLSEEQLTRLADMNWRHFDALQKKEAERPPLSDALLEMLDKGVFDASAFEKEQTFVAAYEALREEQYRERMTTLHKTLTAEQRARLVAVVEAEQKVRHAEEDKRLASRGEAKPPVGCGGEGNRFINRFVSERGLSKERRRAIAKLRAELDRENPSAEKMADHRQAQRLFEVVVRKAFASDRFDVTKLVPAKMAFTEPVTVSKCHQQEFQALLPMLSVKERQDAAARLKARRARRQGTDPNAPAVDGGAV